MSNVTIVTGTIGDADPDNGDTVVYITDTASGPMNAVTGTGRAYKGGKVPFPTNVLTRAGQDWANRDKSGAAVAYASSTIETDANFLADLVDATGHEIGHMLGLVHVNPTTGDPGNQEVMDYENNRINPIFVDTKSNVKWGRTLSLPTASFHNPRYHLKRYVDGVSDRSLRDAGTISGSWDTRFLDWIRFKFDFSSTASALSTNNDLDATLYNVDFLLGDGGEVVDTAMHFDEILLSELADREIDVSIGTVIGLAASSTRGGDQDLFLAMGDPFVPDNLFLSPDGSVDAFLQIVDFQTQEFSTLVDVRVNGSVIPEPTMIQFAIIIGVCWATIKTPV